jgi:hypothetical protein
VTNALSYSSSVSLRRDVTPSAPRASGRGASATHGSLSAPADLARACSERLAHRSRISVAMSGRGQRGKRPRGDGSRGPRSSSSSALPHHSQVSLIQTPMPCCVLFGIFAAVALESWSGCAYFAELAAAAHSKGFMWNWHYIRHAPRHGFAVHLLNEQLHMVASSYGRCALHGH